ncbi:MAG: hypothetical protein M1825_003689 [Sarcosagium campestre]|nr:MAG: hypothetical protein M1825_003689 [Sarcosagium campestre]
MSTDHEVEVGTIISTTGNGDIELTDIVVTDDDDGDRRPQRRRYEEPLAVKLRKQLLSIAESPTKKVEDEVANIAKIVAENFFDEELQNGFYELILQLIVEQPFKIPFAAAILLLANPQKPEVTTEVLNRIGAATQKSIDSGSWRDVKLLLRFLGCLQGLFEGDGIFPILDDLFARAVDLQTASSEDALGLELVKIILFTLPYVLTSSATGLNDQASALLEKTDIIASTPHSLETLVDPYPSGDDDKHREPLSVIGLMQKQLQQEAATGWKLSCIPRPWTTTTKEDVEDPLTTAQKHAFPSILVPNPVNQTKKPMFPEVYLSVYGDQEIETVPSTADIASSILRDALVDTINLLDFNRHAAARFLADLDCYFSPGTFVKRATPFDRLKDVAGDRSTWKPEDVAIDAVFSQLFQLTAPEHKQVYYHSVLTECCKIAPAAIAPSLGRAIRYLYKNVDTMDLELSFRLVDWFSHHLSNFGFTWKWTEWVEDVELPTFHPKKAFMIGALDKEIRLSFAQRIKGTLPEPYQPLISKEKEKDTPDFKFDSDSVPFSAEAKELLQLLKKKTPEEDIQPVIEKIHELAEQQGLSDPLVISTDTYVTAICFIGSKSLSHVLSCIERCKERLLGIGSQSAAARKQIITSVMEYWSAQPGIGINIIDKLLNYTILSPQAVLEWVLVDHNEKGAVLAQTHMFEIASTTIFKVTNRVRQIVAARDQPGLPEPQVRILDETLQRERADQVALFQLVDEALVGFAQGHKDEMIELGDGSSVDEQLLRAWGERWLRVFRRKMAVEEAILGAAIEARSAANGDSHEEMEDSIL